MPDQLPQITKKQHWVPQFYLKKFANDEGKLKVLEIAKGRVLKKDYAPSAVCYDDFFYGVETGKQDEVSQMVEDVFQQIENSAATLHPIWCKKILNYEQLSDQDLFQLSQFMSMLWIRSSYFRNQVQRQEEKITKETMSMVARMMPAKQLDNALGKKAGEISKKEEEEVRKTLAEGKYDLKFNNATHLGLLESMEKFSNLIFHKKWRICLTSLGQTNLSFITSDTPVVEVFPQQKRFYGYSFMERVHHFALSPKILIILVNNTLPGKKVKRSQLKSDDGVHNYNATRLNWSEDYAYSGSEEEFNHALKFFKGQKSAV